LIFGIFVEFGAEDSVGVAVVGGVGLFHLDYFFAFYLVVKAQDWLGACGQQLCAVVVEVQAVQLGV
jgi:hypothetical protein